MAATPITSATGGSVRARLSEIKEVERADGPEAAEAALVAYLREGVQSHLAFLALSRLLAKQKKFDDALRAAAKARSLAPLEADPLVAIGLINLRLERLGPAAEAFGDALRLDASNARALLGAASVKMEAGENEDALALADRVLAADPAMQRARELRTRIQVKLGQGEEAAAQLQEMVGRDPANRRALRAYVRLMRQADRGDEAVEFLKADAEAHPGDRARQTRVARVAALSGRADVATEQFERKEREGGAGAADRARFAAALIQAGELDRAREAIAALGDRRVLRPVALKLEGDLALKAGDPAEALRQYQAACKAANLEPLDAEAAAKADGDEALARAWRAHTQDSLHDALRERRAGAEG